MHELSIAMWIVDTASEEAANLDNAQPQERKRKPVQYRLSALSCRTADIPADNATSAFDVT